MKAVTVEQISFGSFKYESISLVAVGPYLIFIMFRHHNVPGSLVLFIEDKIAGAAADVHTPSDDLNFILLMTGVTCEDLLTAASNGVNLGKMDRYLSAKESWKLIASVYKL